MAMGWHFRGVNDQQHDRARAHPQFVDGCRCCTGPSLTRRLWPYVLLIGLLLFSPRAAASAGSQVTLLGYTFTFDGMDYNPAADESTWYYTVSGPMMSGPTYKDLSHWMMALCAPHAVKDATGGSWERRTNPDPYHGLIGIKWDEEVSKTGSKSFYFVLKGNWAISETVHIGAKAGPDTATGVLPGPACQPDMCQVNYSMTTRADWRFLKPGTYAAPAIQVQLMGGSAVRLDFSDFRDAEYVADWTASPPIRFEYSVGPTLDDAEAFGWHSADQFNEVEVTVPKHAVEAGARVTIWMRGYVSHSTRSSDYVSGGRISIVPLCN